MSTYKRHRSTVQDLDEARTYLEEHIYPEMRDKQIPITPADVGEYINEHHFLQGISHLAQNDLVRVQREAIRFIVWRTMYDEKLEDGSRRWLPANDQGWVDRKELHAEISLAERAKIAQGVGEHLAKQAHVARGRYEGFNDRARKLLNDPIIGEQLTQLAGGRPDAFRLPAISSPAENKTPEEGTDNGSNGRSYADDDHRGERDEPSQ